ncbi:hypothetical protein UPYG_G00194880 [Umbra pygmaea]|uniref:XIAP-associated factor 1 n=1 Tax=Umbra pygmaea TaxID=75934 RepID=A0ABD0WLR3_UMBPY
MAEKEEETTRVCGQCHKEVAASNFALHESHCQRFLCLCPVCEEPVPRELMEKHQEEEHAQVKCTNCNQKMERCQLLEHESVECEERLQCCEFCQLELPLSTMAEHIEACGSRTERCLDCGRYVTLKNQGKHSKICPNLYSPENSTLPFTNKDSREDNKSFPSEVEGYQEAATSEGVEQPSPGLAGSLKSASFSTKGWSLNERGDMDQIRACPHCHLALPVSTLRWHEAKCQIYVCLK